MKYNTSVIYNTNSDNNQYTIDEGGHIFIGIQKYGVVMPKFNSRIRIVSSSLLSPPTLNSRNIKVVIVTTSSPKQYNTNTCSITSKGEKDDNDNYK